MGEKGERCGKERAKGLSVSCTDWLQKSVKFFARELVVSIDLIIFVPDIYNAFMRMVDRCSGRPHTNLPEKCCGI